MNLPRSILRYFVGYDFFISYSRIDGSDYAIALAKKIIEHKYTCYLDQWGSSPGKELPLSLRKKISRSSVFILIGSENSYNSKAVEEEIKIFLKTGKSIVPITAGNVTRAIWYRLIEGMTISNEEAYFYENKISENLLTRLANSFIYTRQTSRIRNSIIFFLLLIIVAIGALINSFNQVEKSKRITDSLNDSIAFKTQSITKIEDKIKLKQDSLNKMSALLSSVQTALTTKEKSLNIFGKQIKEINGELDLNKGKLRESDANLISSQKRVNDFNTRILKNAEPEKDWNCEKNLTKETVIIFDQNSDRIKPNFAKLLNSVINCANLNDKSLIIEAYDFENHSAAYARSLSMRRGLAVKSFFINNGIIPSKVFVKGMGNTDDGMKILNLTKVSRIEVTFK